MWDDLLSPTHLIVLLLLALLIFGPKRLPELGSSLGKTIRDFKHELSHTPPTTLPMETAEKSESAPASQSVTDHHVS